MVSTRAMKSVYRYGEMPCTNWSNWLAQDHFFVASMYIDSLALSVKSSSPGWSIEVSPGDSDLGFSNPHTSRSFDKDCWSYIHR